MNHRHPVKHSENNNYGDVNVKMMILGRRDSTSMNTVPMTGKSWQRSNDFSFLWLRYKWYVPLTYIFQGSAQDPKTTWMNVSSDKGLNFYFGLLKWFSAVVKERAFDEESPTKNQDWSFIWLPIRSDLETSALQFDSRACACLLSPFLSRWN